MTPSDLVIPPAQARASWPRRLLARLRAGPRAAQEGLAIWATSLALTATMLHMAYFLACCAWMAIARGEGVDGQVYIVVIAMVGMLMFAGLEWVVTATCVLIAGAIARGLKLPRILAALWIGAVAGVTDVVASAGYWLVLDEVHRGDWVWPLYGIAAVVGVYFGWSVPGRVSTSIASPPPPPPPRS